MNKLLEVGDFLNFKECNETPVAIKALQGWQQQADIYGYDEHISNWIDFWNRNVIENEDNLQEMQVIQVDIEGDSIKYILGKNGCPTSSYSPNFEKVTHYPTIHGNELMNKILIGYKD